MSQLVQEQTMLAGLGPEQQPAVADRFESQDRSIPWVWLFALLGLAIALRAIALNQQLWYDEIVAVVTSLRQPLSRVVTTYGTQNQHTLYSILAQGFIAGLGEHSWTLRMPAMLFGALSVPMLYFFGRLVTTRIEALLAAALMTVSYHHVWFSQNARGYTALLFWTLLATYLFLRGVEHGGRGAWVAYSCTMALGMYTHLTMGLVALAHTFVYLWLAAPVRKTHHLGLRGIWPLMGFLLAGLLTLALYAPMLPQLLAKTVGHSGASVRWEWKDPMWLLQETLRGLQVGVGGGLAAILAGGLIGLSGLASYWRRARVEVALMLLPCLVTGVVMLALEHNLWPRFFFFAIGFAFLLLVRGAFVCGAAMARRLRNDRQAWAWGLGLVALMLAGSAWSLPAAYRPKQDFVGAMQYLDARRQADEPVVTVGLASFAYQRYFGRDWPAVETYSELEAARGQGRPAWLLYTFPVHLRSRYPDIWQAIQTEFTRVAAFPGTLGGGEIYVCRSARLPETSRASR